MTLFERLRCSLYLAGVAGAAILLVISIASADIVGWLPASADLLRSIATQFSSNPKTFAQRGYERCLCQV
jgi:hypothetical protein